MRSPDVHGRPFFAKRTIDASEGQVCSRTFGLWMQLLLLALMESAGWLLDRLHALIECCVRQGFANHSLDLYRHQQLPEQTVERVLSLLTYMPQV